MVDYHSNHRTLVEAVVEICHSCNQNILQYATIGEILIRCINIAIIIILMLVYG